MKSEWDEAFSDNFSDGPSDMEDGFLFDDTDLNIEDEDDDLDNGIISDDTDPTPQFTAPTGSDEEETEEEKVKKKAFKKTAIILVASALGLIIFALILLNVVKVAGARKQLAKQQAQTQQTVAPTQNTSEIVDLGGKKNKAAETQPAPTQAPQPQVQKVEVIKDPYDWQAVDLTGYDLTFGDPIESTFTITDIKTYARLTTTTSNDKQLRAVVMGSISGLVGTYTLELPADKALKLRTGLSFTITYQLKEVNGYKLVGEIQY